ncbi:steroid 5 alpha-reductase [Moniliophthora roreri MCA 2997]|uniref:Steroid 5 alpha-reductase n=1 Tax=Moniliophthora roreri (strain MCA 2997) TaxID=1381753 RepID=V2XBT9_MONRO|nr:steroid 5 alpha-reductase [Moniliophthora roreri MCA 2997]
MALTYLSVPQARYLYDATRKWFVLGSAGLFFATFFINAPFGRFAQKGKSLFLVNGIKAWILMELVSPTCFLYTFFKSPLSLPVLPGMELPLLSAQKVLAAMYLIHYLNRALINPLRTPSRSKAHVIVPLFGVLFNVLNGSLMGSYLSSPAARLYLGKNENTWGNPLWYIGLGLWAVGFVGNVWHDEILLNIRRRAKTSGKKKDDDGKKGEKREEGEHYAIPHGLLYKYVSFPNYFCEWVEWAGFALAAAPLPFTELSSSALHTIPSLFSMDTLFTLYYLPPSFFAPRLTPPWVFLLNEIVLMFPRAYKGHQWYKTKFGEAYPKERNIVIPFVL